MSKRKLEVIDLSGGSSSAIDLSSPSYNSRSGVRAEADSASERASVALARQLEEEERRARNETLEKDQEMARLLQAESSSSLSSRFNGVLRVGGDLADPMLGIEGPLLGSGAFSGGVSGGGIRAGRVRGRRNNNPRGYAGLPFADAVAQAGVGGRVRGRNNVRRAGSFPGDRMYNEMFLNAILANALTREGVGGLLGEGRGIGMGMRYPQIPAGMDPRLASLMTRELNENDYETLLELQGDSNLNGASESELASLPTFVYGSNSSSGSSDSNSSSSGSSGRGSIRRGSSSISSSSGGGGGNSGSTKTPPASTARLVSLLDTDSEDEESPVHVLTAKEISGVNKGGGSGAAEGENEREKCPVCMEEFALGDKCTRLPCMHFFHTECIQQWLKINKCCPVDKKRIDEF